MSRANRREFLQGSLALAGLSLLGGCQPSLFQPQQSRSFRLGFLGSGFSSGAPMVSAFREALQSLGYVEGQHVHYEYRLTPEPIGLD